jgi:hypothetical protein
MIPADVDRSIAHINPNIDCPDLEQLINESVETVTPWSGIAIVIVARDLRIRRFRPMAERVLSLDRQGRWFSLRIRPYKNLESKIDGAVLSLFDIDILKRAGRARAFAEAVLDAVDEPFVLIGDDLRVHVCWARSSANALSWCGDRCWMNTYAMPSLGGKASSICTNASKPPAEAPIATTGIDSSAAGYPSSIGAGRGFFLAGIGAGYCNASRDHLTDRRMRMFNRRVRLGT